MDIHSQDELNLLNLQKLSLEESLEISGGLKHDNLLLIIPFAFFLMGTLHHRIAYINDIEKDIQQELSDVALTARTLINDANTAIKQKFAHYCQQTHEYAKLTYESLVTDVYYKECTKAHNVLNEVTSSLLTEELQNAKQAAHACVNKAYTKHKQLTNNFFHEKFQTAHGLAIRSTNQGPYNEDRGIVKFAEEMWKSPSKYPQGDLIRYYEKLEHEEATAFYRELRVYSSLVSIGPELQKYYEHAKASFFPRPKDIARQEFGSQLESNQKYPYSVGFENAYISFFGPARHRHTGYVSLIAEVRLFDELVAFDGKVPKNSELEKFWAHLYKQCHESFNELIIKDFDRYIRMNHEWSTNPVSFAGFYHSLASVDPNFSKTDTVRHLFKMIADHPEEGRAIQNDYFTYLMQCPASLYGPGFEEKVIRAWEEKLSELDGNPESFSNYYKSLAIEKPNFQSSTSRKELFKDISANRENFENITSLKGYRVYLERIVFSNSPYEYTRLKFRKKMQEKLNNDPNNEASFANYYINLNQSDTDFQSLTKERQLFEELIQYLSNNEKGVMLLTYQKYAIKKAFKWGELFKRGLKTFAWSMVPIGLIAASADRD